MPGTLSLTHRHRIPSLDETDYLEHDWQAMSFRKEAVGRVISHHHQYQFPSLMQYVIVLGLVPNHKQS